MCFKISRSKIITSQSSNIKDKRDGKSAATTGQREKPSLEDMSNV